MMAGTTPQTINNESQESFPIQLESKSDEQVAHELTLKASIKYNVSFNELWETIGCETQWTYISSLQSYQLYRFSDPKRGIVKGQRELSYGLAQIHLPDHPEVTLQQATDPVFATDFIAKNWTKHKTWWSCWTNKQ